MPEIIISDPDISSNYTPERGLLAGVLERSYRDLFSSSFRDFNDGMNWFKNRSRGTCAFTYADAVEYLELSANQLQHITKIISNFEKYCANIDLFKEERKYEGEESTTRISQRK